MLFIIFTVILVLVFLYKTAYPTNALSKNDIIMFQHPLILKKQKSREMNSSQVCIVIFTRQSQPV